MNRSGITAFVDAVIFMMLMMVALSFTLSFVEDPSHDGPDAPDIVDALIGAEVRMSDLADGDGSSVPLTDLIALHVLTGEGDAGDYLEKLLDAACRGHPYLLELGFSEKTLEIGEGGSSPMSSKEATVPVSTGGELSIHLTVHS